MHLVVLPDRAGKSPLERGQDADPATSSRARVPGPAGKTASPTASLWARAWARVGEERGRASAASAEEPRRAPTVVHAAADPEGRDLTTAVAADQPDVASAAPGRHRLHRFPARRHALKVLYGDDEHAMITRAAELAGLRPSSYVATAALAMAEQVHGEPHLERADEPSSKAGRRRHAALTPHQDRELLAELIQARLAFRRYAVNVNQIAAALNSGGRAPAWLPAAVAGADRAVARLDTAAQALARRLR